MQNLLLAVDRLSTWIGKFFAWSVIGLTLLISWEVFSRYVMNKPHAWVLDAQIMLYGTLFMCAGAYTLSKAGHVRGDVLYGFFKPRTQATIDLLLYIVFFMPGIVALTWAGMTFFQDALAIRESTFSATPRARPAGSGLLPPWKPGQPARSAASLSTLAKRGWFLSMDMR